MKCPSCGTPLAQPLPRCPECKLTLQRLDLKFGMVPRHSRYLSDRSGRLELSEMESIRAALRLFEKKFPQILFSVLLTEVPGGNAVNEYTFWLANRARFSSVEKIRGENYDLLLVIDVLTQAAALSAGYGLELYVSEEDLQAGLDAMAEALSKGQWAPSIHACIEALIPRLRACSDAARQREMSGAV